MPVLLYCCPFPVTLSYGVPNRTKTLQCTVTVPIRNLSVVAICISDILYVYQTCYMFMKHTICIIYRMSYMYIEHAIYISDFVYVYRTFYMYIGHAICISDLLYAYQTCYTYMRHVSYTYSMSDIHIECLISTLTIVSVSRNGPEKNGN